MDTQNIRPLKTYSKRVLQDCTNPPGKRQRVDNFKSIEKTTVRPPLQTYSKPVLHDRINLSAKGKSIQTIESVENIIDRQPSYTFSRSLLQESIESPSKRQRTELQEPVEKVVVYQVRPSTPALAKKRSITDYFKPPTYTSSPSTLPSSVFSSDPPPQKLESPPSSPPLIDILPSAGSQPKRARRRLNTKPSLIPVKMFGQGSAPGGEDRGRRRRGRHPSPPFEPGSPPRTSWLTRANVFAGREAPPSSSTEGSSSSGADEESNPGDFATPTPRSRSAPLLTVPFAPARRTPILISRTRNSNNGESSTQATSSNFASAFSSTNPNTPTSDNNPGFSQGGPGGSLIAAGLANAQPTAQSAIPTANVINHVVTQSIIQQQTVQQTVGFTASVVPVATASPALVAPVAPLTVAPVTTIPQVANAPIAHAVTIAPVAALSNAPIGLIVPLFPAAQPIVQAAGGLVQTQLLFGGISTVTCRDCNCTYNRANEMDSRIHREFHDTYLMGIPLRGLVPTSAYHVERLWSSEFHGLGDYIVVVDHLSHIAWKDVVVNVLETHVDRDLGAEATPSDRLWSTVADPTNPSGLADTDDYMNRIGRFKIYLYVKDFGQRDPKRVVSLLLAERINEGYEAIHTQMEMDEHGPWPAMVSNTTLQYTDRIHEAVLGVNKIWTHCDHRRKNHATFLLDRARDNFIWSYRIPRIHVAFTHTTEDGAGFAERYFRPYANFAFLAYTEEQVD